MGFGLTAIFVVALFGWAHWALERNVNRMAQQLQDQLNDAAQRVRELETRIAELENLR